MSEGDRMIPSGEMPDWRKPRGTHSRGGRFVMGGVIVLLGILFLLQNLGIIYVAYIWQYWPVILIAMGLSRAAGDRGINRRASGGLIAIVGLVFLARNLGYLHADVWQLFWPAILILVRGFARRGGPWSGGGPRMGGVSPASSNVLDEHAVFGGIRRRIESQEFEGGEVNAIFGGVEIDLRSAATKKDEIVIELNAVFGGVELRVPDTWDVTVRGAGIFGGYEDKTMPRRDPPSGKRPRLVITGDAVFGGVTVM
jgi:hypothetical protein